MSVFEFRSVVWEMDMGLAEDLETHKVSPSSMSIIGEARCRRRYGLFACRKE